MRLDKAGHFAALKLAAERGDIPGFKQALREAYMSPAACKRIYEATIDEAYEYALQEVTRLAKSTKPEDYPSFDSWTEIVSNHNERHPNSD